MGPHRRQLEEVLNRIGARRQEYHHSGAFVGNHVDKMVEVQCGAVKFSVVQCGALKCSAVKCMYDKVSAGVMNSLPKC